MAGVWKGLNIQKYFCSLEESMYWFHTSCFLQLYEATAFSRVGFLMKREGLVYVHVYVESRR